MDCVFCEIIAGKKDCFKIYEDENAIAFLDINPVVEGHTLVMPKRHVERLEDLSDEEAVFVFRAIKRVVDLLLKKLQADGYNVVVNVGRIAGQEIFHLHFHIFPRKRESFRSGNLEEVYRKIMGDEI